MRLANILIIPFIFTFIVVVTGEKCFAQSAYEYNEMGVKYMDSQNYLKAVEMFKQAYQKDPESEVVRNNLSYAYTALANKYADRKLWDKAIRFAKQAYDLNPSNDILASNLSVFYTNYAYEKMKKSYNQSAVFNLKTALKYDSNNWRAYVALGQIAYEEGNFTKTIKYWEKALALNSDLDDIKKRIDALEKESKVENTFRGKRVGYFEVKYEGYKKQYLAQKVLKILREAYKNLGNEFRYYPKQTIPVIIYTKEQFKTMTGSPDWIKGTFDGIIRVNASDVEGDDKALRRILYHEFTHALLYRKTANNLPVWFNEGLAQYKEPQGATITREDILFLRKQSRENKLISLADLNQAFFNRMNREQLQLAYLQAKLLVKYMDERYYFFRIRSILDKLGRGDNMETALQATLHINSKKLEKNWLKWIKEKYKLK
jgi:tetratricopeptide (TPR) repeat protein